MARHQHQSSSRGGRGLVKLVEATYTRALPTIRRAVKGDNGRAKGDIFINLGQCSAAQIPSVTPPYLPPKVFQAAGRWVFEFLICCCIHYARSLVSHYFPSCAAMRRMKLIEAIFVVL